MADAPQTPAADNATAGTEFIPPVGEIGPNGLPVNPPQGEAPADVDNEFIMNTFFGDGAAEPPKSDGGQASEPKPSDGQSQPEPLAPPAAAPAATGSEGGSQEPAPSPSPQPAGEQAPPAEGAAPQTPAPGSQPAAEPQPSAISVEDRLTLANARALAEQNQQLIERLRALEAGGQPQPGQPAQPGTQPAQPGAPAEEAPLRLVVPDTLFAALNSDDPNEFRQGLNVLITAVAQNAVQEAVKKADALVQSRMGEVVQTIQGGKQVEEMETKFFERFPQLNNQLYRPLIQQTTEEKYKLFPHAAWDEVMMDAVGATVQQKLQALGVPVEQPAVQPAPGGQAPPTPKSNGGKPPKPAPMLDTSTRGEPQDAGDFISATFS